MGLTDYQRQAAATAIYPKREDGLPVYATLGLASEAGELAGKVKKAIRDGTWDRDAVVAELGDVLWYVAAVATDLGVDLDGVAAANLAKLASRAERGTLAGSGDQR